MKIVDLKTIFQLIRCFGGMFTHLEFIYYLDHSKSKDYDRIVSYIQEFSKESLTHLELPISTGTRGLNEPFLNVEYLKISKLCSNEKCLSRLFPKLRHLMLYGFYFNFSPVSEYFPNLYHLSTLFYYGEWSESRMDDYGSMLQLNPNLRKLTIKIPIADLFYFDRIKEHMQFIDSLEIFGRPVDDNRTTCINTDISIHLQNVTKLSIFHDPFKSPPKIPLLFSKLKEFQFEGDLKRFDSLQYFFNANRSIEKFTYGRNWFAFGADIVFSFMTMDKIQEIAPSLKNFIFLGIIKDTENLLPKYLSQMEYLESISFRSTDSDDRIRAYCANKWRVTRIDGLMVTLQRIHANI